MNNSNGSFIQIDQQNDILINFIRNQATSLLKAGIELEVSALLKQFADRKLSDGRQAVCRK